MKICTVLSRVLAGRRRLARGSAIANTSGHQERWNAFLDSDTFKNVKKHYVYVCNQVEHLPSNQSLASPYWEKALTTTCTLWHVFDDEMIFSLHWEGKELRDLRDKMWDTLVFLMQGVYFLNHGCSLTRLNDTSNLEFLLHAATYSLSRCISPGNENTEGSSMVGAPGSTCALYVFRQVLRNHQQQQLGVQIDPVSRRTPLHIAAANKLLPNTDPFSESEDFDVGCSVEIFEEIVSQTPSKFASMKDGTGSYPLHLAAASGYAWSMGLETLFRMAPYVVNDRSLPPVFVLASTPDTLFELLKATPHLLQKQSRLRY